MGFWKDLLSFKQSRTSHAVVMTPGQPQWMGTDYRSFAREGYQQNVVAFQCINMIADAAGSVPIKVTSGDTEFEDHPIIDLMKRPNPMQSGKQFIKSHIGFCMISGNAYIEGLEVGGDSLVLGGTSGGTLKEVYPLRPDRMRVIPDEVGNIAFYRYEVNGKKIDWPYDRVNNHSLIAHYKRFNPLDDWYGMSPITAAAYAIDQHNEAMAWMQSLLQNSAQPSGALISPDGSVLTDETFNKLKAQIDEQFVGAKNAGRPLILEGGLDWKQMGMSPVDMAIIESKFSSARDIALAFGIPPMMLGIPGDNTYSNYKEARLAFWEDTVIPELEDYYAWLTQWLQNWWPDVEVKGDYDRVPAIADKNAELWARVDASAELTIDEKRELKGLPPIGEAKGGNAILVDSSKKVLDFVIDPTSAPGYGDDFGLGGDDFGNDDLTEEQKSELLGYIHNA